MREVKVTETTIGRLLKPKVHKIDWSLYKRLKDEYKKPLERLK